MTQAIIAEKVGRSESTISRTIKKFKEFSTGKLLCGNGRNKKLKEVDICILKKVKANNPKTSLRKASMEIAKKGGSVVSYNTIRRWYNDNNIFAYSPIKKPFLSKRSI
ncbi:hypothetical protein DMUE_4300, partial [Dictyocoela muelleri]